MDLATRRTCERLLGRFLGLAERDAPGAAAGLEPIAGAWWIRSCTVTMDGERVSLRLAGPGFTWIDVEERGFAVRQYVDFDAHASVTGDISLDYARDAQLLSIWFRPSQISDVQVTPIRSVKARPQTFLAGLVDIATLGLLSNADAEIAARGSELLEARLQRGLSVSYDVQSGQIDVLLGQLERGEKPKRPFADDMPWIVNERVALYPGGVRPLGPLAPGHDVRLELESDGGVALSYKATCRGEIEAAYDAAAQDQRVVADGVTFQSAGAVATSSRSELVVSGLNCPFYLLLYSQSPERTTFSLRLSDAGQARAAGEPARTIVRLTLLSARLATHKPDGAEWDALGDAPDPIVYLGKPGQEAPLFAATDRFDFAMNALVPHPVEIGPRTPATFTFVDDDALFDDPIGVATLTLADAHDGEQDLPIVSGSVVTGTVRVRVEVERLP